MPKAKKNKKDIQFEQPSEILILINRYLMLIIAFIIIVIAVSGYFLVLKPKIDSISISEERTVATEDRREVNEILLAKIQELEAEYYDIINHRQEDLDLLKKMIPEDTQAAEIFLLADLLADRHGFKLMNVDINDVVNRRSERAQTSNSQTDNQSDQAIESIDALLASSGIKTASLKFSISKDVAEGSDVTGQDIYTDFKDYLSDLENNMRLLDVQSMVFRSIDAEPGSNGPSSYDFDLDLITYYQ